MRDHSTLDGIFDLFYSGVSGPAGFEWDRESQRALYLPGAPLRRGKTHECLLRWARHREWAAPRG